jgi:hypothetical protein
MLNESQRMLERVVGEQARRYGQACQKCGQCNVAQGQQPQDTVQWQYLDTGLDSYLDKI